MKFIYLLLMIQCTAAVSLCAQTDVQKDSTFTRVEKESEFPGGEAGWLRFLKTSLTYPPKAVRKKIEGTVVVQFIVDKTGALSDIKAISGPEILQEAAVDVIKNSPNWKPAFQYGKKVKSYKIQPITFRLQ